ncbi:hypothetical protein LXL04_013943 [Taraxacum kok-saghyz]
MLVKFADCLLRHCYTLRSFTSSYSFSVVDIQKKTSSSSRTMAFQRGDRVEISSKDQGFEGSYYLANIIACLSKKEYIIQYRTLLNDDGFGPVREIVPADQIQPVPPEVPASGYSRGDVVDAYEKDGWWIGKISGKIGSNYVVYFKNTNEEIAYPSGLLRIHQDWINGAWVNVKREGKCSSAKGKERA